MSIFSTSRLMCPFSWPILIKQATIAPMFRQPRLVEFLMLSNTDTRLASQPSQISQFRHSENGCFQAFGNCWHIIRVIL